MLKNCAVKGGVLRAHVCPLQCFSAVVITKEKIRGIRPLKKPVFPGFITYNTFRHEKFCRKIVGASFSLVPGFFCGWLTNEC